MRVRLVARGTLTPYGRKMTDRIVRPKCIPARAGDERERNGLERVYPTVGGKSQFPSLRFKKRPSDGERPIGLMNCKP
jgi:hypothetical protein